MEAIIVLQWVATLVTNVIQCNFWLDTVLAVWLTVRFGGALTMRRRS